MPCRCLAFTVLLVAGAAHAAVPESIGPDLRDLGAARTFGMSGAHESLGYGAESIGGNPAALSLYHRYQIEATGVWDVPLGFGNAAVSVADSASSPVAAGISYNFVTFGGTNRRWAHLTTMALATPLAEFLHIGVAVRHQVLIGATNTNSVTMNAGIMLHPFEWLSAGFSGHNLINNFNGDITRYFVASVSGLFFGQLSPAFDLRMDFNGPTARFSYSGGVEWLAVNNFPLRAGYERDDIGGHQHVSAGVGYFVEGSGVDLSYRHELGGTNGRVLALTVKMQLSQ